MEPLSLQELVLVYAVPVPLPVSSGAVQQSQQKKEGFIQALLQRFLPSETPTLDIQQMVKDTATRHIQEALKEALECKSEARYLKLLRILNSVIDSHHPRYERDIAFHMYQALLENPGSRELHRAQGLVEQYGFPAVVPKDSGDTGVVLQYRGKGA